MMRSMYAGVSGLKAHQTRMDVVGNNIANVNTTGYKGSRVTFKEMLNQTLQGAKAAQNNRGGMNPQQVGLGVSLGSIDTNQTQGNLQSTGIGKDLAIQGNGYFVVNNGNQNFYTRAGALSLDENGNLVNASNGYIMQGWIADNAGIINTNNALEGIRIPIGDTMNGQPSTTATFENNLDSQCTDGVITKNATIDVYDSLGAVHTVTVEFTRQVPRNTLAIGGATGDLTVVANGPDTALNGMQIQFTDTPGASLSASYTAGPPGTVIVDSDFSSGSPADLTAIEGAINDALENAGIEDGVSLSSSLGYDAADFATAGSTTLSTPTPNTWDWNVTDVTDANNITGNGVVTFNTDGTINTGLTGNLTFDPTGGAATGQSVALDFSSLTQSADPYSIEGTDSDGYSMGSLESFSVDNSGIITGSYSNGLIKSLGQISIASFSNPSGLTRKGDTLFAESQNSGMAQIGTAATAGRGKVSAGTLEMSNVDLAEQFTDMITTQRGFQANSKIITTADQMLQDLVNLKR